MDSVRHMGWILTARKLGEVAIWVLSLGVAAVSVVVAQRTRVDVQKQRAIDRNEMDQFVASRAEASAYVGRHMSLDGMAAVNGRAVAWKPANGYRGLLVVSELSCAACADREAWFANRLVSESSRSPVAAVVESETSRYAGAFARVNESRYAVFFDESGRFKELNKIGNTPLWLVLDEKNLVVSAEIPVAEKPEWTNPFHIACTRLLASNPAATPASSSP